MLLSQTDQLAIRTVIEAQLQAFRQGDARSAFALASPAIHLQFKTEETFRDAVRKGYPQMYSSREVEFGDVVTIEGYPAQQVLLTGDDGISVIALYIMERQPSGSWRISGCVFVGAERSEMAELMN